MIARVG